MIDMKKFYMIGTIAMFLALIGNVWSLSVSWNFMNPGAKLAGVFGGAFFNLLFCILFYSLWKSTPETNIPMIENKEVDDLIKEYQNNNKKQKVNMLDKK